MKNLTLGTKIYLSAGFAAILIATAGTMVYSNLQTMKQSQAWVVHTNKVIAHFNALVSMMVDMETGQRGMLMSGDEKFLEPFLRAKDEFDPSLKKLRETVSDNPLQVERLNELEKLKHQWVTGPLADEMKARKSYDKGELTKEQFTAIVVAGAGKVIMDKVRGLIAEAVEMESKLNAERMAQNEKTAAQTTAWLAFGLGGAILLGGVLLGITIASAMKNLKLLAGEMLAASEDLTRSSNNLSQSSQSLAASATQQAASLQETAASLQEITSMTQATANNANLSSESTEKSSDSARRGQEKATSMAASMTRINESNEAVMTQVSEGNQKISQIVDVINEIGNKTKIINDIVFQTKLLSFNASVEAARAGEHGKGFAVVAEEVGSLATMSGNAAQEISTLLNKSIHQVQEIVTETQKKVEVLFDGSRQRLQEGTSIAAECEDSLNDILKSVATADTLAKEIAQAAGEQTSGVEQINVALSQLEQLTQTNTQAADEASALSEDLSKQAHTLNSAVARLGSIIGQASSPRHSPSTDKVVPLASKRQLKQAVKKAA